MFDKVLVANRGAVAARIVRALRGLDVKSVCVYSDADRDNPYLADADEVYHIGPARASESYLNADRIIEVAHRCGADAIHPGYGFLSESTGFARRVIGAGIAFIGPHPDMISAMAHKTQARELMAHFGVPVNRGSSVLPVDSVEIERLAEEVGYPLLVKPAAGGGGIGMSVVVDKADIVNAVRRATSLAMNGFGNSEIYLEKYLRRPRHIELQVLGDKYGKVRHLYERDCSVQRRHQKLIEEAGAPNVPAERIEQLGDQMATTLAKIGYDNIGTVEMLMSQHGEFCFLEMNTRLQVEHGVTEEVTSLDLVQAQVRLSAGETVDDILPGEVRPAGHAIEARVYAEDPHRFLPSPGPLEVFRPPADNDVRIETGYAEGVHVTPFYDPLLAKVIVHRPTREAAVDSLISALEDFDIRGLKHNIPALLTVLRSESFRSGALHTTLLAEEFGLSS